MWCGADLPDIQPAPLHLVCPCCNERLAAHESGGWTVYPCEHCSGLWMTSAVRERFEELYESVPAQRFERSDGGTSASEISRRVLRRGVQDAGTNQPYRLCPQCRQQMARRRYGRVSGVIVDECLGHGVWFDPGEFSRAVEFLRSGGIAKAREYEADAAGQRSQFQKDLAFVKRFVRKGGYL